jgi:hypothetical protein
VIGEVVCLVNAVDGRWVFSVNLGGGASALEGLG